MAAHKKKKDKYDTIKNKARFLIELQKSKGIVLTATTNTGISRETYYRWLGEDVFFAKTCEEIQEQAIDFVESQLLKNIEGRNYSGRIMPPDTTAMIFYLKTKGKKRGYIEKTETDTNLNVNIPKLISEVTEEQKKILDNE